MVRPIVFPVRINTREHARTRVKAAGRLGASELVVALFVVVLDCCDRSGRVSTRARERERERLQPVATALFDYAGERTEHQLLRQALSAYSNFFSLFCLTALSATILSRMLWLGRRDTIKPKAGEQAGLAFVRHSGSWTFCE